MRRYTRQKHPYFERCPCGACGYFWTETKRQGRARARREAKRICNEDRDD